MLVPEKTGKVSNCDEKMGMDFLGYIMLFYTWPPATFAIELSGRVFGDCDMKE